MPPPPAGRRPALRRLAGALRRRLRPDRGAPPATVPGLGSGEETALAAAARPEPVEVAADVEPEPEPSPDAPAGTDARFDEARERLRATIEPPDHDAD